MPVVVFLKQPVLTSIILTCFFPHTMMLPPPCFTERSWCVQYYLTETSSVLFVKIWPHFTGSDLREEEKENNNCKCFCCAMLIEYWEHYQVLYVHSGIPCQCVTQLGIN